MRFSHQRHLASILVMSAILTCLTGCDSNGNAKNTTNTENTTNTTNIANTENEANTESLLNTVNTENDLNKTIFITDISKLTVDSNVQIVGLGEASHGTSEFQQLKGEVFKALVSNNGCRVFAIEGDFGGCAVVNDYIHGIGELTAQEASSKIGFKIYRTQEMVDLIEWMRIYNETAPVGEDLKFYGFDAQRFDNNKTLLFAYLTENFPTILEKYTAKLSVLTDEDMYSLDRAVFTQAETDVSNLINEMEQQKSSDMDEQKQYEYERAYEYAQSILENIKLCGEGGGNEIRDQIMARKVEWIEQHEDGLIYINGHNGHISKQSATRYTCMGEQLNEVYGEEYFPIATDAKSTVFNALDGDVYKEFSVENENFFTDQLDSVSENFYYLDFKMVDANETWQTALQKTQTMTALNVEFSNSYKLAKQFYTLKFTPSTAFSGVIVFKTTSATSFLE